ncbi:hypothetical protein SNE40_000337 [Patella caerulea]|uniref:Uncharacterized protein n=1 Tax=Patella caerulea TaxID=87958 RepID=A0AAN8K4Z2_PATCE
MNTSSDLYDFLYGQNTLSLINASYFSDPKWNSIVVTPGDLESVLFNISDMLLLVTHGLEYFANPSRNFQTNYKWPMLACFTYNGQWETKDVNRRMSTVDDQLIMYIDINQDQYAFESLTAGMHLCIHPPDEPFDVRTPCSVLSPGHAYEVSLNVHHYTYLPHPYNSYQSSDCITTSDSSFRKNLKYFHRYSYRGCQLECLTDMVLEKCGCITEYEVQNASDKFCTVTQRQDCVAPFVRKFYFETSYSGNITELCDCPRPCSNVVYGQDLSASFFPAESLIDYLKAGNFASSLEDARSNLMRIIIKFDSLMVTHISHVPEMTLDEVVSSMGGFMGFFLGASVLTVLEVFDVIMRTMAAVIASYFKVEIVNNKTKPKLNENIVKDGMPSVA